MAVAASADQFDFLFEAAREGLELQQCIDDADVLSAPAMADALLAFMKSEEAGTLDDVTADAVGAFERMAKTENLHKELKEKERVVGEHLAGMHLSVRVLEDDGAKPIANSYFSIGATGSRQQEFGDFRRRYRKGMFRAVLLGENALVMYPQWMTGHQMDNRNILVPIL